MKVPCDPKTMLGSFLCYAFAVATLLEMPMDGMPTVTPEKPTQFIEAWNDWYRQRGLVAYRFDKNFKAIGRYLGYSFHEGTGHVVIMRDGEVEYDPLDHIPPAPDDPLWVYFTQRPFPLDQIEIIVPRDPAVLTVESLFCKNSACV